MTFDKNSFPFRAGMTLNSGDIHGFKCARVSGGGGGGFSATVDSDSFNVPSHGQRISYENTFFLSLKNLFACFSVAIILSHEI